jgi:uncharacterized protein (TIGR03435 family)
VSLIQLFSAQPWVERLGWTLIHFLWQGALLAAIYAIARRSRTTQVRYLLACLALAAMTIAPIVTFAVAGTAESTQTATAIPISPVHAATTSSPTPVFIAEAWHDNLMPWLVMAWLAGAMIFWTRLTAGWIVAARMRSMLVRPAPAEWQRRLNELKTRIPVSQPVRLLTSALVQVPTVVGWLRPVVLMPIGALAGLPTEHIEALLAHELAHIRRHDYLINILQTAAEALLFYHPAVWWISTQIRNDRELCCDDVAVAISGDALIYARALADLESYRPAHLSPALAANGGSLADRIARLLGHSRNRVRTRQGPGLLFAVCLLAITAWGLFAQPSPAHPSFEVAAIKPSPPEYVGFQSYVKGERYTAMTATVRNLVAFAYGIRDFQISGGPAWSGTTAYNVSATMPAPATADRAKLMLQSLLADRFHLRFHRITKNRAGYALIIDKNGPKLTESKNPGPGLGLGRGNLNGRGATMRLLAGELSAQLESPIADRTGLTALYDFTLKWTPDVEAGDSSGPSIFTAIQEQLSLRLDAVKNVPVDILVIDAVEKPTEN